MLPLTKDRAKPAVPFGGAYRLIDFALSNFANAGYLKIVVLTQYMSHSLDRHISQTWLLSGLLGNYVTPVPAQMRRGPHWFTGSADAIYQNLNLITDENPDIVCVFGADHIYRMDPRQLVDHHLAKGAGVTVAAIPVGYEDAKSFGVIESRRAGSHRRLPREVVHSADHAGRPDALPGQHGQLCVRHPDSHRHRHPDRHTTARPPTSAGTSSPPSPSRVWPACTTSATTSCRGRTTREKGYWRDVGTIDSYYDANMDLLAPVPVFNLYNDDWPVFTSHQSLPPAKISTRRRRRAVVCRRQPVVQWFHRVGWPCREVDRFTRCRRAPRRPRHRQHPVPRCRWWRRAPASTGASSTRT